MERSKILVVGGIVIVVILSIWLLTAIIGGGDEDEQAFREALIAQSTVLEISEITKSRSGDSRTQELAASIASTTASDLSTLSSFYASVHGGRAPGANAEAVSRVDDARENVEIIYAETASEYLSLSLERLEQIKSGASSELAEAIDTAIDNQRTHLSKLEANRD